ncbi:AAA family ATPase [Micromonospora endolithica]|uniref:MinD/ParA family protein n=1 Tax=Micromonospora endolithica TaxID=230091 RepID=A0A3A9ZD66_9ACTN|nr:P-loop NTPase [Micromonospora endolithica]RKN46233.1 MinD/ParA family protein [Micromonospora endolithica]TWJ25046.1 pilus assembly protein CpaE [Micromonospora endolithica]
MTILFEPDRRWSGHLAPQLGPGVLTTSRLEDVERLLADQHAEPLVLFGPGTDAGLALEFAARQRVARPAVGVLLLRERLDVETMGHALRAGVRDVVDARDIVAVRTACARAMEVSRHLLGAAPTVGGQPTAPARVVTVFSAKGGVGKSTLATNLAVSLAEGGKRKVCLVDLDLAFGDVGIMLQLAPERGIADAVAAGDRVDATLVRALLTTYAPGVEVLLAPVGPSDAERIGRDLVAKVLAAVRTFADYVVVDTPAAFTDPVLAAFDVSDVHVLVATPDVPVLKNLRVAMDTLDLLGLRGENRLVVLNRGDARVGLTAADVERVLKTPITAQVPSSRDVPVSINRGVPIVVDKPNHPVSAAIRDLALGRIARQTTPRARGLRDRLGRPGGGKS